MINTSFPEPDYNGKKGLLYWSEQKPNSALASYKKERAKNTALSLPLKLLAATSLLVYGSLIVFVITLSARGLLYG